MNKQIKNILLLAGLFLTLTMPAGAQGLYENCGQQTTKATTTKETTTSTTLFRAEGDDWDEPPGDPNPTDTLPVGEGMILLAMLAGVRYMVQGARKMNN